MRQPGRRRRPCRAPSGRAGPVGLSAEQASIRAALSWALGGAEPEAGRELAARLARWWIATGRYSEAGQFLTRAAGIPAEADPGIQARVLLGAAWSAYHLGDNPAGGPARRRRHRLRPAGRRTAAGSLGPQPAGRPGVARGRRGPDRRRNRSQPGLSGRADPALAARAQVLLANAAFLAGDLAEQERHGLRAIELARTAAGQEGLALALTAWSMSAIAGAGIQPATVAALDEAANVAAAHPDRFAETIMRQLRARAVRHHGPARRGRNRRSGCAGPRDEAAPSGWWNSSARWPRPASPLPGAISLPPLARSAGPPTAGAASG